MILRVGTVYDTEAFRTLYSYNGSDLGVHYSPGGTRFCVWAPTASAVNILLYENGVPAGDEYCETIQMARSTKGTWTAFVPRELKGMFYTYQAFVNSAWSEAVDPYVTAVGANGLRGQIIDMRETDADGWENDRRVTIDNHVDAVIYELHVRDLSSQPESGITNRGKFLGLAERGSVSPAGLKTGLDHILELGVTHVHLLPVFDYKTVDEEHPETQFNWGYDPQNYNVPEGSYSTNPYDGTVRIREFKQMIKTLHDNGLGVIMDVVYNHVYDVADSPLERLVPGYFFRTTPDGELSNGSGCGNETASERYMVRKFITDSVVYWAKEYHIDGFRFDLMGLHDIETMNHIRDRLDEIDPSILMYGEGWTGGDSPLPEEERASEANLSELSGIAVFNSGIRDAVKGSVFDTKDRGFVSGGFSRAEAVKKAIAGSGEPTRFVNYCSSHDNHTLWDKLSFACRNDRETMVVNKLAAAILFTSQGIPFFQAGEEMARTKGGDDNSYRSPDGVNQLDWNRKADYLELYNYYKGLILLRKTLPEFRLRDAAEVAAKLHFINTGCSQVIAYTLGGKLLVVFNADGRERKVKLPNGRWSVLADGRRAGTATLGRAENTLNAQPVSAYVLKRDDTPRCTRSDRIKLFGALAIAVIAAGAAVKIFRRAAKKRESDKHYTNLN